jgi:hypothetical protein
VRTPVDCRERFTTLQYLVKVCTGTNIVVRAGLFAGCRAAISKASVYRSPGMNATRLCLSKSIPRNM